MEIRGLTSAPGLVWPSFAGLQKAYLSGMTLTRAKESTLTLSVWATAGVVAKVAAAATASSP